jgi:hypothetical protein
MIGRPYAPDATGSRQCWAERVQWRPCRWSGGAGGAEARNGAGPGRHMLVVRVLERPRCN